MTSYTIAVTGGSGFIGRWVSQRLLDAGHEVMVVDHHRHNYEDLYPAPPVGSVFLADVRDETAMYEVAAHVDGIIHLAAVLGTQETISNPRPSAHTNIVGALNVFEAASQYDVPVVYAGVGNHWMRDHGTGSYTISKTAAEDYARMFNAYRDGNISVVRPMNAYGPGQSVAAPYGTSRVRKIMPSFVCRALVGDPIQIYGDGTQISDCVYVEDVANVFATAMERALETGSPLETPAMVGPAESHTVNEIAELVRQAAYEATHKISDIEHLPMRPGEVPNAVVAADISTLLPLGIDAQKFVSLYDGIAETVGYYVQHWLSEYRSGQ